MIDVIYSNSYVEGIAEYNVVETQVESVTEPEQDNEEDDLTAEFLVEYVEMPETIQIRQEFGLSGLISKVRTIVKLIKNSPTKIDDIFHKHCRDDNHKELSLLLGVKTRWNSTFDMIERCLLLSSSINKTLVDIKKTHLLLTREEIDALQSLTVNLSAIKDTTVALSSRKATLITLDTAIKLLLESFDTTTAIGVALRDSVVKRINERRTITSDVLQYLHNKGRNSVHPLITKKPRKDIISFIRTWASGLSILSDSEEALIHLEPEETSSASYTDRLKSLIAQEAIEGVISDEQIDEFETDIDSDLRIYENTNKKRPQLTQLHNNLLSVQVTSVEAERNFSSAGLICNRLRSQLGDDSLNALSFLHSHFVKEMNKNANIRFI